MPLRIERLPAFNDDLTAAYFYVGERNPASANKLFDEVEATIELLSAFPQLGRSRDELRSGVRSFVIRPFRYILFYRVTDDAITLLRFLHGAREKPAL